MLAIPGLAQKAGIGEIALPVADLFASRDPDKSKALMGALDAVNALWPQ